jgi:hypothetical protein
MSSLKQMQWGYVPSRRVNAGRLLAAALLRGASAMLARMAMGLASEPVAERRDPCVEFHAEAGAPEGALYVDGRLVGWLPGVSRL